MFVIGKQIYYEPPLLLEGRIYHKFDKLSSSLQTLPTAYESLYFKPSEGSYTFIIKYS